MSVCGGGGRLWMVVMNRGTIGHGKRNEVAAVRYESKGGLEAKEVSRI